MPHIKDHIDRCIELYGAPLEVDYKEPVLRESYEQMRADLMLAVGMLMVLDHPSVQP